MGLFKIQQEIHTHTRPDVHNTTNTHTTEITNATTGTPNRTTKEKSTEKPLSTAGSRRKLPMEVAGNHSSTAGRRHVTCRKIGASAQRESTTLPAGKNRRLSSVNPSFSDLLLSDSSPSFFVEP
jgi:hypothetical protein